MLVMMLDPRYKGWVSHSIRWQGAGLFELQVSTTNKYCSYSLYMKNILYLRPKLLNARVCMISWKLMKTWPFDL
jgi:hypothetical protein